MKMRKTVAVDFDGTLCYYEHFEGPFKMGEPLKGAKEFLQALRDEGFRIVIFSCRPKSEQLRDAMGAHLDKNGMVYDKIFLEGHKPPAIAQEYQAGLLLLGESRRKVEDHNLLRPELLLEEVS
mgnify:CR=1 FL=1